MNNYHNVMQDYIQTNWKHLFPDNIIPSKSVKCSQSFYKYLISDGIFIHNNYVRDQSSGLVNDQQYLFPEIQKEINLALQQYKSLFVKVNWKSGKDSKSWIDGLQCTHIEDVLKLIKCSSYIAQILEDYESIYPQHLYLILKKYQNLDRNLQFRCFINNQVISICQRSTEHVFVDIQNKDSYHQKIVKFIKQMVIPKFNKQKFVLDLYVPRKKGIKIIDIGPWRQFTNPLLFEWDELQNKSQGEFKLISNSDDIVYQDLGNYNKPNQEEMKWLLQQITGFKG